MINRQTFHSSIKQSGVPMQVPRSDFLLVLLLLCFSGNPALCRQGTFKLLTVGFAAILALMLNYQPKKEELSELLTAMGLFGIILAIQSMGLRFLSFPTLLGFFIRLFLGFAIVKRVSDFPDTYVRVMYYLAILSLFFYIPEQIANNLGLNFAALFQPLADLIGTSRHRQDLFFHTFMTTHKTRNAGMFWEPGAFAGYINLALVFLGLIRNRLSRQAFFRHFVVLSITLFTTLSTTGYFVYPIVLLLVFSREICGLRRATPRSVAVLVAVIPLLAGVFSYAYFELDFMQAKMEEQSESVKYTKGRWHRGRLGSAVFDWST